MASPRIGSCATCGIPLPPQIGRGRPRKWCAEHAAEADAQRKATYKAKIKLDRCPVRFARCLWCDTWFRQASGHNRYCCDDHHRAATRDRLRPVHQRRRARLLAVTVEDFRPEEVFRRDGWVCQLCGDPATPDAVWPNPLTPTLDHIIPLALGGEHSRANTQCAHYRCNCVKGARVEVA